MWYCPDKYKKEIPDVNAELSLLTGYLEDKEAKISLARFLRANLGFTTELISGIKLAPYQEITLRGLMNRNFSMCVWGRGCGKSFVAAVYCFLQCVFEPNTRILIAGPTFRTARFIFNYLEKIVNSKGAELLAQAFGAQAKRNDHFEWQINGGSITAIPLNGEKIRGFRANVLLLDEFLLLPEELVKNVLMPFLVAPHDMKERIEVREIEDSLIQKGLLKEEDRMVFDNSAKMIAMTSASYTFENLYKTYQEWTAKIYDNEISNASYFVSQMAWDSIPDHMIDNNIIEEAQNGGTSNASFLREYCAQFTDGSDSYFSAKKMHDCTVPDGEQPTVQVKGDPDKKYILAIDPNMDDSPSADYFAMALIEIDEQTKINTLVHSYAGLGNLSNHVKYLHYVLNNFNVVFAVVDNAGADVFLGACNESETFKKSNINLKQLQFDSMAEDMDYTKQLISLKKNINVESNKIFFNQVFTSDFIRRANEYLQASIDYKRIYFASKLTANAGAFTSVSSTRLDFESLGKESILEHIEDQELLIYQTKKQCALIEVKSTIKGTQSFDLPQHLKRSNSPTRARRDNYTALMLANWASRCYYDALALNVETENTTFMPRMI